MSTIVNSEPFLSLSRRNHDGTKIYGPESYLVSTETCSYDKELHPQIKPRKSAFAEPCLCIDLCRDTIFSVEVVTSFGWLRSSSL